jgi:hypothetical protein
MRPSQRGIEPPHAELAHILASGSRRKRTTARRGWFATGVRRAPSATTPSASPNRPRSSDRGGHHDRPGSAPAGTASRTRQTSRPPHGSQARSTPCCSQSAAARPTLRPGQNPWTIGSEHFCSDPDASAVCPFKSGKETKASSYGIELVNNRWVQDCGNKTHVDA